MSIEDFSYTVESQWSVNEGRHLADVICVADACDLSERSEEFDDEIRHVINECNLVHLNNTGEVGGCTLTIKIPHSQWNVTKISIVSEGRIVELYGAYGEYISTTRGVLLCNSDDIKLYNAQPDVNIRLELTIKFPGVTNAIWIYGIKLLVRRSEQPPSSERFDYSRVDEILKSSKFPLSETADQAKQFLQKYSSFFNSPKSQNKRPDSKTLLKMLESEYKLSLKPMEDAGRNVSQYVAGLLQTKNKEEEKEEAEKEEGEEKTKLVTEMKAYVDESVKQLEERVENSLKIHMEALEAKQSKKMDLILQMLSNK